MILWKFWNHLGQIEKRFIYVLPFCLSIFDLTIQMIISRLFSRILIMNANVFTSSKINKVKKTLLAKSWADLIDQRNLENCMGSWALVIHSCWSIMSISLSFKQHIHTIIVVLNLSLYKTFDFETVFWCIFINSKSCIKSFVIK